MERRSFFGVAGGLLGFLGLAKATEKPITDLPIIKFDKYYRNILNIEEIFAKNSEIFEAQWSKENNKDVREYAKAYLTREDSNIVVNRMSIFYGPVFISRVYHRPVVEGYEHYPVILQSTESIVAVVADRKCIVNFWAGPKTTPQEFIDETNSAMALPESKKYKKVT